MKTLDEVIKALKENPVPMAYTAKVAVHEEDLVDALHYLQEYQGLSKMWNDRLDKEQENDPLTWDELKGMEGKPVWVEHKYYKIWLIVKEVYEETIVLDGNGFYTQFFSDDNEKETRWQAYRKERG